jgi:hypothetical protein
LNALCLGAGTAIAGLPAQSSDTVGAARLTLRAPAAVHLAAAPVADDTAILSTDGFAARLGARTRIGRIAADVLDTAASASLTLRARAAVRLTAAPVADGAAVLGRAVGAGDLAAVRLAAHVGRAGSSARFAGWAITAIDFATATIADDAAVLSAAGR